MDEIGEALRRPAALVAPCVLLLLAEHPSHGYQLAERLKDFGFTEARSGSMYRELRRLEDGGLVQSYWEASQTRGPARRVYELTASGREALVGCADGATDLAATLDTYLRRLRAARRRRAAPAARRGGQMRSPA